MATRNTTTRSTRFIARSAAATAAAMLTLAGAAPLAVGLPPMLPPEPVQVAQPVMVFPEGVTFEFGDIWDHERVEHDFVFENGGNEPFEITGLRSTCGCTISAVKNSEGTALAEGRRIFQPGERGVIVAEFNPAARVGRQIKPIYITLNNAARPQYTIRVSSQVSQVLITDPPQINMRGIERFGDRPTQEFRITGRGPDFDVTLEENPREDILSLNRVGVEETQLDGEPARTIIYEMTVLDTIPMGRTKTGFRFSTTDERKPFHAVQVAVSALGDLATDPPRMNLGELIPGREFVSTFVVRSKTRRDFEITDVIVDGVLAQDATAEWTRVDPLTRDAYEVTVRGIAGPFPRQSGRVKVRTSVQDERQLTVSYLGWVRQRQNEGENGGGRP
ncbi:MAG: DUF1573 domain-containing protein [Planctomycetota bacterium]